MAKNIKTSTKRSERANEGFLNRFSFGNIIPEKFHTLAAIIVIFLLFLLFFSPLYFSGKTFQSGDITTIKSYQNYVSQDKEGFTLWNPFVFCGMPAYATSTAPRWFDAVSAAFGFPKLLIPKIATSDYAKHTFNLLLIAITFFIFMRSRNASVGISLLVGVATAFSTGIIVFLMIGHITKLVSLTAFPIILMVLLKYQKKISLIETLILIVFLHYLVLSAHVQMIFYVYLAIGIYYAFYLIHFYVKKEIEKIKQLVKSLGMFTAASLIAVMMSYDIIVQLYEYAQYSTRGAKSILEQDAPPTKQAESDFYQYATNWSFSPGEVLTFIVPSYYGFGASTYNGPHTGNRELEINTYFGQMPFVDVAMYMGVIILFLGLFAIYACWSEPFVRFLTILSGISLLISFGRTFPILYDLMFYYVPFFDKFRVPSMILTLIQMSFPLLAGIGLMKIVELKSNRDIKIEKVIKYSLFVFAGLFVISLLFSSMLSDWFISRAQASEKGSNFIRFYSQYNINISAIMSEMFISDLLFAFGMLSVVFGSIYGFIKGKLNKEILIAIIFVFVVVDLLRIDSRGAKYVEDKNIDELFTEPEYVSIIKAQNDADPYRLLNLKQDGSLGSFNQNSNFHIYFLKHDMYGYSGIKPRTFQDIADVVTPANPTLWRMLNVRYIVADQPLPFPGFLPLIAREKDFLFRNENALPRAYFVDTVAAMPSLQVLQSIKNNEFDPAEIAFVSKNAPIVDKPDSNAYVNIIDYKDEYIKIEANATGTHLLFVGDTYYPYGWTALINGNETEILQVNHGFRGVIIPPGKHTVELIYAPVSFFIGKYLAMILSGVIILGFIVGVYFERKKKAEATTDNI